MTTNTEKRIEEEKETEYKLSLDAWIKLCDIDGRDIMFSFTDKDSYELRDIFQEKIKQTRLESLKEMKEVLLRLFNTRIKQGIISYDIQMELHNVLEEIAKLEMKE